jgi:hypothetical protein
MKPENLINWGELSRILSGTRSVVTKNRMPKKYEKSVSELLKAVTTWYDSIQPDKTFFQKWEDVIKNIEL